MERWTETDERNLFMMRINELNYFLEEHINKVKTITNGEIKMKNFGKIYQKKIFDLEQMFKDHGMSYFNDNWVRRAIDSYFSIESLELYEMLEIINRKLSYLNILYLNNTTTKLANTLLERLIKFYNQKVEAIKNFTFENNLRDILMVILTDERYYMYNKGDFINFYKEMLEIMTVLGQKENFLSLDPEIRPLVVKAENKRSEFISNKKTTSVRGR